MNKKMVMFLVLVIGSAVVFSSCTKTTKAPLSDKTATNPQPIESTIDPKQMLQPTPVTGEKANNDPASIAVKDYFFAIQAKQYEKAYALITGEFKKKKGTFTEFVSPLAQAAESGRVYDKVTIQAVNSSESGMEKIVTFSLTLFENQSPMTLHGVYVVIQQKDLTWMITDSLSQ
jgi:hypothetical protein